MVPEYTKGKNPRSKNKDAGTKRCSNRAPKRKRERNRSRPFDRLDPKIREAMRVLSRDEIGKVYAYFYTLKKNDETPSKAKKSLIEEEKCSTNNILDQHMTKGAREKTRSKGAKVMAPRSSNTTKSAMMSIIAKKVPSKGWKDKFVERYEPIKQFINTEERKTACCGIEQIINRIARYFISFQYD